MGRGHGWARHGQELHGGAGLGNAGQGRLAVYRRIREAAKVASRGAILNNVVKIREAISAELEAWVTLQGHQEQPSPPAKSPQSSEPRWNISPILNELRRRKTLTTEEHAAACRFLRELYLGLYSNAVLKSQQYQRSSRSASGHDPVLEKIHYAKETEKVILAIDPIFYPALQWLVATLGEGKPLSSLGDDYAPGLGSQTQSARAGAAVALLCANLCKIYGIRHRLADRERIEHLSRVLLEVG